jgi:hypothetical protein
MGLISLFSRMKLRKGRGKDGRRLRRVMLGEIAWGKAMRIFGIESDRFMYCKFS